MAIHQSWVAIYMFWDYIGIVISAIIFWEHRFDIALSVLSFKEVSIDEKSAEKKKQKKKQGIPSGICIGCVSRSYVHAFTAYNLCRGG